MNTLLLVGGELCERTAPLFDPAHWKCIGLRRSKVTPARENTISWHEADLLNPESLSFLSASEFSEITHILYAPSPARQLRAPSGKLLSRAQLRASGLTPARPNARKCYAAEKRTPLASLAQPR